MKLGSYHAYCPDHTALIGLEAELCGKISHRDPEIYTEDKKSCI